LDLKTQGILAFRKHLIISGLFLVSEAWIGIGIGTAVGMMGVVLALVGAITQKEERFRLLGVAAIYALLCVATVGILTSNWRVAQHRAAPVISAIDRFHSDQGRYPNTLDELVPAYLPSIPRAGFTWLARRFGYYAERPQLYFPAMFHGVVSYDFSTHSWTTND
jgi:hypothetical protein